MKPVCSGAPVICSCGTGPSVLLIKPNGLWLDPGRAAATILDCVPVANIPPFPGCTAPGNPVPSLGVKPCLPAFAGAWTSITPTHVLNGVPLLDDSAILPCALGGVLRISYAGQVPTRNQL